MTDDRPKRPSIGTLLIWAVNLPLVAVLAVLLPLDYQREMEDAIAQKHASLEEEAITLYQGLSCLAQKSSRESVQRYIDTVCVQMKESRSPGHHIAVRWNDTLLQAEAHHRDSPEIVRGMQQAAKSPNHRAAVGDETLVVGTFTGKAGEVYVSEYTTNIRRSIQHEILLHLGSLVVLAVTAGAIVNFVLWRIVTRPVTHLSNTVSRIALGDYDLKTDGFPSREMNELSAAIRQMSETLATNEQERRAQLDRARCIQDHLLPNDVVVPGLAVAHLFQPADEVAGDYYDLIRLPDDTWLICVADVAGHGVAAAMGSAMLKALVLHAVEQYDQPLAILQQVNERLPALLSDGFITMFLASWNSRSHRLEYVSAGHEPGLLLSSHGEVRELPATGLPLGIDPTATWETETIDLSSGDRLLLTTDGVAESCDAGGELFGRQRLAEVLSHASDQSPDETVRAIRDAVSRHEAGSPRLDDVTVLLIDVT